MSGSTNDSSTPAVVPVTTPGSSGPVLSSGNSYEVGELVWAKIGKFPWWPSIVVSEEDVSEEVRKAKKKNATLVRFFADPNFGWMKNNRSEIRPFRGPDFYDLSRNKNKDVQKALQEALTLEKDNGIAPTESEEEEMRKHAEEERKKKEEKKKRRLSGEEEEEPKKKKPKEAHDEGTAKEELKKKKKAPKETSVPKRKEKEQKETPKKKKKKEEETKQSKKDKKEKKKVARTNATLEEVEALKSELESSKNSQDTLKALKKLRGLNLTLNILVSSKIGKTIKKLAKKEQKDAIASEAKALVKRYQKLISHEVKAGNVPTEASTTKEPTEVATKEAEESPKEAEKKEEKEEEPNLKPMETETVANDEKGHNGVSEHKEETRQDEATEAKEGVKEE